MLINDNVPKLLNIPENQLHKCEDEKEFFALLKQKLSDNINKIFDSKDIDKKVNALFDAIYDLQIVRIRLGEYASVNKKIARLQKTGGYEQKYVYEPREEIKIKITDSDIQKVKQFGLENHYPAMILKRIDNKITKKLGASEEAWENAISWSELKSPYSDNFLDLLRAIDEKDFYRENSG